MIRSAMVPMAPMAFSRSAHRIGLYGGTVHLISSHRTRKTQSSGSGGLLI